MNVTATRHPSSALTFVESQGRLSVAVYNSVRIFIDYRAIYQEMRASNGQARRIQKISEAIIYSPRDKDDLPPTTIWRITVFKRLKRISEGGCNNVVRQRLEIENIWFGFF